MHHTLRISTTAFHNGHTNGFKAECDCGWKTTAPMGGYGDLKDRMIAHRCGPPAPMLVHIYDADERSLISESIDLRLAFPQGDGDLDYLVALYDIVENDRHFCGGGTAPTFLIVAAHAQEPLHVLAGDL